MVKTRPDENNENIIISYSDNGKQIRPVFDRLDKPIREDALYSEAYDIIVNGMPRYDYIETDIDIEKAYVGADGIEVVRENAETIEEEE